MSESHVDQVIGKLVTQLKESNANLDALRTAGDKATDLLMHCVIDPNDESDLDPVIIEDTIITWDRAKGQ